MTCPLLQVRQLEKSHGDQFALRVPELNIQSGEVVGLLGPTGAGKSTLLRILSGLERPTSGDIRFAGEVITGNTTSPSIRRRIAMVFQDPLLLAGSVAANVRYGLTIRGQRDGITRVAAMLDRLGLTRLVAQSARTLSGGQTQLVALARALVVEPDVLLLDEPTANLDPAHVGLVEEVLQEQRQHRPLTIIWSTHNLFQARRVADRVAFLLDGHCVECAPTDEFFDQPADPRTAAFVQGKMVY